jgi:hypothetical protein
MVPWRYVVALVVLAAVVGGVSGALVARDGGASGPERGGIVRFGGRDGFSSLDEKPFCVDPQHFCIVQKATGELIAMYTYDPHPRFRSQGCTIDWRPDFLFIDPVTGQDEAGWFRGGCSGSTFDLTGQRVFGPAPRDLDQFALRIVNEGSDEEYIEVDTRVLICGAERLSFDEPCERAPRPE